MNKMKRVLVLLVMSLGLMSSCANAQQGEGYQLLKADAFLKLVEETTDELLLDVRTPAEFNQGNIEGAINLDYYADDFRQKLEAMDKTKPVFIYCASGGRSHNAIALLQELGFGEIYELKGGYRALGH